jgi:hypothetical protein
MMMIASLTERKVMKRRPKITAKTTGSRIRSRASARSLYSYCPLQV